MTNVTAGGVDDVPRRAGLSGGWLTLLFVAVVATGFAASQLGGAPATAEVGQPAPPFAFEAFDGSTFDLDRHFGEGGGPIVLNLWASWCEPCKREFPALSDYAAATPEVTVIGVAVQDQLEDARAFASQMDPAFVVGFDADDVIRDAYPSFGLPTTFLIDGSGRVVDIILAELTPERLEQLSFEAPSDSDGAA